MCMLHILMIMPVLVGNAMDHLEINGHMQILLIRWTENCNIFKFLDNDLDFMEHLFLVKANLTKLFHRHNHWNEACCM